ncbi:hypothetical protein [Sphingomonas echinoides]|uniref:Restriction endonuclease type IV Mrr domain-containing protein n=1 Tax=Sphingomonas echinoides TaxID=59803 RepID=A0ABU4PVE2_9SPHN|nr:hypothetical protein [Sphingomonas echinoides]MDX5985950.1 hypothetical protein [Sphingomonas echinoides]
MQVSKALNLGKTQPELDFVDIDLSTDTPLFLDPAAFYEGQGRFAEDCSRDIETFFEAVLHAAGEGDHELGVRLLRGLKEPDEIQFGFSVGPPRGRGVGEFQAEQIFEAILRSKAIKSGLIRDLNDALIFVPGIGPDKVSDITTNIVRRHLIEYTQNQFALYGIEINTLMPTGLIWDSVSADWTDGYDYIPVINDQKFLLVPKRFVKYAYDFTKAGQRYYTGYVANFIRQRELTSMGRLVRFRESKNGLKTPHVYNEDIHREVPRDKNSVADFSMKHPEIYERFKNAFFKFSPMSVNAILAAQKENFHEIEYGKHIVKALSSIPSGDRSASDFQSLVVGIIHFILYPQISNPVLERSINDKRKRIDISFDNTSQSGVFSRIRQDPFMMGREIMIECKNYTHDLKNPEIDQLIGRFDPRRGRFGIIVCRNITDRKTMVARCADAFKSQQGVIVVLTDADLEEVLLAGPLGRATRIDEIIQGQLRDLLA